MSPLPPLTSEQPVTITTPDGKERTLVWRLGSEKLIVDWLGCTVPSALLKYDTGALPDLLYACMYDDEMEPPKDLTRRKLAATLDPEKRVEYLAVYMSAVTKGKSPKNEIEAMLNKAMDSRLSMTDIGSLLGVSLGTASGSPAANSMPSQNGNSTPSASDTTKSEMNDAASQG